MEEIVIDQKQLSSFGERVKTLRNYQKMSQTELAEMLGLQYSHISRYENGGSMPSAEMLMKLSKALSVSVDYLLFGEKVDAAIADFKDKDFLKMFQQAEELSDDEKELVKRFLSSFLKEKRMAKVIAS